MLNKKNKKKENAACNVTVTDTEQRKKRLEIIGQCLERSI